MDAEDKGATAMMTTTRYTVSRCGTNLDGTPNYGVTDTMPGAGSDGRVADFRDRDAAQAFAADRNARFAEAAAKAGSEGRVWSVVPGRGIFAWLLRPQSPATHID